MRKRPLLVKGGRLFWIEPIFGGVQQHLYPRNLAVEKQSRSKDSLACQHQNA